MEREDDYYWAQRRIEDLRERLKKEPVTIIFSKCSAKIKPGVQAGDFNFVGRPHVF
jgi:hypothetical protein